MKRRFNEEYTRSVDSLCFSPEAKEAMIRSLTAESVRQKKGKQYTMKKALYIALAAALLVATMTGAAVYTRWSASLRQTENTTQEQREEAEKTGLALRPDETTKAGDVTTAIKNGVTISLTQALVDQNTANLVFTVSGYEVAQGEDPSMMMDLEFGKEISYGASGSWYYKPYKQVGDAFQLEDGTTIPMDSDGGPEYIDYHNDDGNLEYLCSIQSPDLSALFGTALKFHISELGTSEHALHSTRVLGPWELSWTVQGSSDSTTVTVEKPIGDTGIVLKEVTLTPMNLEVLLQLKEEFKGFDELEPFRPCVLGVRTRDGQELKNFGGGGGDTYEDREKGLYRMRRGFDGILDADQVDAILFGDWDKDGNEIVYTVELP